MSCSPCTTIMSASGGTMTTACCMASQVGTTPKMGGAYLPEVEVVRSARRRRTVQARQVGDVLRVSIPSTMTKAEEERWVAEMVGRVGRRAAAESVDLQRRAQTLAARYRLPPAQSVRWVDNQQ